MSIFADREILTSSATLATLALIFGGVSQFTHRADSEYYFGYVLIGGGTLLLLATVIAWHNGRMIGPLRYLLGALLALLLLGLLTGHPPIRWGLPHGQFV